MNYYYLAFVLIVERYQGRTLLTSLWVCFSLHLLCYDSLHCNMKNVDRGKDVPG